MDCYNVRSTFNWPPCAFKEGGIQIWKIQWWLLQNLAYNSKVITNCVIAVSNAFSNHWDVVGISWNAVVVGFAIGQGKDRVLGIKETTLYRANWVLDVTFVGAVQRFLATWHIKASLDFMTAMLDRAVILGQSKAKNTKKNNQQLHGQFKVYYSNWWPIKERIFEKGQRWNPTLPFLIKKKYSKSVSV